MKTKNQDAKGWTNYPVVLKVCAKHPCDLSGDPQGQSSFDNNTKMLFTFVNFIVRVW